MYPSRRSPGSNRTAVRVAVDHMCQRQPSQPMRDSLTRSALRERCRTVRRTRTGRLCLLPTSPPMGPTVKAETAGLQ